jgi:transposase InsO family protein
VAIASSENVQLPKEWSKQTKAAFLCAVSLAHRAIVIAHSWCFNSRIPRIRNGAEIEQLRARVALLEEITRIKDRRMQQIQPEHRPHYPPTERLAILAVKAAEGWNNAQAGREFLVADATIARWLRRLNDGGEDALVALPMPVNRFPDFVTLLVQRLKTACPLMGRQRIADTLARAGLRLSASTARRMLKKDTVKPTPSNGAPPNRSQSANDNASSASSPDAISQSARPNHVVTAKRPGHVWHVDLSAVPTLLGYWVPWIPYCWAQHWPFCFWTLVVIDHYSRKAMMLKCFRGIPTAAQVTDTLDIAIAMVGCAPKHIISDHGAQFGTDHRNWCELCRIKPRFGAIGQHGSIAIVERFIRTIKQECVRRIVIPLATEGFERELIAYARWYNEHRPHQSLHGRTPNEVYEGRLPARDMPRIEVRRVLNAAGDGMNSAPQPAENVPRLRLIVKHFENRKHLPLVELERAA